MSHASPMAKVPDEVQQKVADSKLGLLAPWLPQQFILNHKVIFENLRFIFVDSWLPVLQVCGWFVSHVGHNSLMESLTEGVPL